MQRLIPMYIALAGILTIMGCASPERLRRFAFYDYQNAFTHYDTDETIQETIVLEKLVIHIVGSHAKLRAAGRPAASPGCVAWSNTNNVICIMGRRDKNGNIVVNQAILA